MNNLIRKSTTPFGALIVAVLFLIIMAIVSISSVTHAVTSDSNQSGRLITIHDRGTEKIILSQAVTIGDALAEAGIVVDINDVVEPAITEKLIATDYQVNIYRARPVIIVDGNIRQKIMTPYQTSEQIASSAGITLYPEDKTEINRVDNIVDGAGLQLVITRAIPFYFTLYGKTSITRTQAKTIGEMLTEKKIVLSDDDRVLPVQDRLITEGMSVRVWREGKQTVTIDEPVDFEVEEIQNADQSVGYRQITTPGEVGARSVTYEVMIEDGQEVDRIEIASIAIKQPVMQVEVVGTKATTPDEARVLGHQMMLSFGYSEDQWTCLDSLWYRESKWLITATNSSSGAYGIPQSLPASKMIVVGDDYLTNAATQISWGLSYIKNRYTTPCSAWSHSELTGWY